MKSFITFGYSLSLKEFIAFEMVSSIRYNMACAYIIGITHVFSCINICRVPRKLFEHEAFRPSFQTSSEGPSKC